MRRIFGEPYERNGVTIIPAASIRGGSGGGGGDGTDSAGTQHGDGEASSDAERDGAPAPGRVGSGGGAGFGLVGRPVGAFVIKDGEASWRPAIDVTGIVLRTLLLGAAVYLATRALQLVRD